jgi:hypothetical protein
MYVIFKLYQSLIKQGTNLHTAIIIVSILMLALALIIPLFLLGSKIAKTKTTLGTFIHFWELFFITVYLPCLWFLSFALVKTVNHFLKG